MTDGLLLYRYFLATAKQGSVSGAAKALFVSQPAVSAALRQLEKSLGVTLFFRSSRGMALTAEGELLLQYVTKAFSFLEAGEEKLREIAGLEGGFLRIGASDMTLRFFLLEKIERFTAAHPKVRLTVTNAPTPSTLAALRGGEIDLCVVSAPFPAGEDLISYPVREIRDIFIASDRFALRGESLRAEQLADYPVVMLEKNTSTRRFCDTHLRSLGVTLDPAIELATSDLVLEFAKKGIGIGCVVEDFAADAIARGEVYEVHLNVPFPKRHFCLVESGAGPSTAAAAEFLRICGIERTEKEKGTPEDGR